MKPSRDIARLIEIMAALRTPGTGCPWDLEQNFATIAPYTIEEAYEVADAIARGDLDDLRDELGDLLLQVVFHARMAEEQGAFDFGDVVEAITDQADPPASACVRRRARADAGRRSRACGSGSRPRKRPSARRAAQRRREAGALAGVPVALPALTRALKLQAKAGKVGFDWNDPMAVLAKIREEADEIEAAIDGGDTRRRPPTRSATCCSPWSISPAISTSIRRRRCAATNQKFERRFAAIEAALARSAARRRRRRRWPRWTRSGTQAKAAERKAAGSAVLLADAGARAGETSPRT